MSIDFDKIFSTNASSTPFTWSDSDYLVGWDSIENTPPSRQQFNALHMISDLKDQELNNVKAPKHSPVFTGDPQAPTPAWNDSDTSIATTSFVQHWVSILQDAIDDVNTGSYSGNAGYVDFNGIAIFQWGAADTDSTFPDIPFHATFPNDVFAVFTAADEPGGLDPTSIIHAYKFSTSIFKASSYNTASGNFEHNGFMWLAIGR